MVLVHDPFAHSQSGVDTSQLRVGASEHGQCPAAPKAVQRWEGRVLAPRLHPLQMQLKDRQPAAGLCFVCSNRQSCQVLGIRAEAPT